MKLFKKTQRGVNNNVLTGSRAGRFAGRASKPASAQIGLADTVDSLASESE